MERRTKRQRTVATEREKQELRQLKELEIRLHSVRSTKLLLQQKLDQVNAEAKRLESNERKSRQQLHSDANKLTRVQLLQSEEAKRREEANQHRVEEEALRLKQAEEERQRRERSVNVQPDDGHGDLDNLDAFLADDSAFI